MEAGLYDDWVAYQAQMKAKKEALRIKQKKLKSFESCAGFIIVFIWGGIAG